MELKYLNARAREESICTRTLNSNTKYLIAFALAIQIHRMVPYLDTSKKGINGYLLVKFNIVW
jgi:hypothetical protein